MSTLQDEQAKLREEIQTKQAEIERLGRLAERFPDLRKYVGRWNRVVYCSKSVNDKVDQHEMVFSCGCCSDSVLRVWPYLETPDGKVYSDPPHLDVGERYWRGGAHAERGWDKRLKDAGIAEAVIESVKVYFRKEAEARRADAESEYDPEEMDL